MKSGITKTLRVFFTVEKGVKEYEDKTTNQDQNRSSSNGWEDVDNSEILSREIGSLPRRV